MTIEERLAQFEREYPDVEFGDGAVYRVAIPAAIYTTVRSREELERVIEYADEYEWLVSNIESVKRTNTVLYVGYGDEAISVEDAWEEDEV